MHMSKKLLFSALAAMATVVQSSVADDCATACPTGTSGPVKLFRWVPGGPLTIEKCEPENTDITFPIPSSWTGENVLVICHCGATTGNIGRVTITGELAASASLFVAVVGVSQDLSQLDQDEEPLDFACIDFGGLVIAHPDTLAKTRASISVTGLIEHRGTDPDALDIEVNQVVRIQADNAIDANIRAAATGTLVSSENNSIGQVRAGHAIRGNIIAAGGDISTVRVLNVDPLPAAEGTADILRRAYVRR